MVARGEVWWFESRDGPRRPVLVLTRDEVAGSLRSVLVASITTRRRDLPTEVALEPDDGMPRPCVVTLDNVSTRSRALLVERITRLGPDRMREVCVALGHATGC